MARKKAVVDLLIYIPPRRSINPQWLLSRFQRRRRYPVLRPNKLPNHISYLHPTVQRKYRGRAGALRLQQDREQDFLRRQQDAQSLDLLFIFSDK